MENNIALTTIGEYVDSLEIEMMEAEKAYEKAQTKYQIVRQIQLVIKQKIESDLIAVSNKKDI